jgi:hypothetical protein
MTADHAHAQREQQESAEGRKQALKDTTKLWLPGRSNSFDAAVADIRFQHAEN